MNLTDFKKSQSAFKGLLVAQLIITALLFLGLNYLVGSREPLSETSLKVNTSIYIIVIFFSSLLSWSIFVLAYYAYPQVRDKSYLVTGFIFFTAGLLDGAVLVNMFMFTLFGDSVKSQPILSWYISQIFAVSGFAFFILFHRKSDMAVRRLYPSIAGILAAVLGAVVSAVFPVEGVLFIQDKGLTLTGLLVLLFFSIICALLMILLIGKFIRTKDVVYKILSFAVLIMIFSHITMLSIQKTHDNYHLLSRIYQLLAYVLLFNVFYVQTVKRPYQQLSSAQDQLNGYLAELDVLVDKRTTELRSINEKLVADQEIARSMQMSMLPSTLPHNEYVRFSSGYVPADNLSGDFYNVFPIDDVQFGICIGDVSGHGVSAAMLSIFTFQKMQTLMEETGGDGMAIPSMVLKHIYESFNSGNFSEDMYIVMLYGVFNTQTGIFSYASGGLNTTPLRIRPDGSIQELDNGGYAICKLGDLLKPKFVNHQVLLFPGDKLLLYTDGLVDARNASDEPYSIQRLKDMMRHHYKWGVEHLTDALIKDVRNYTENKLKDDITVVAFDVLPPF